MAPPRMFWRYLTLTLLLGIPSSHILTSATYESSAGAGQSQTQSRDQLIEQIVNELTREQVEEARSVGAGVQTQDKLLDGIGENSKAGELSKKDDVRQSASQGVNFAAAQESPAAATNDRTDGNADGGPTDGEGGAEAGTDGVHKVTYAAPGKYEAHRQRHPDDDEGIGRKKESDTLSLDDTRFAVVVGSALAAGFVGLMMAGICYYKFRKNAKAATDIEYPAYGVTGPMKEKIPSPGDRKLAQSAQMYHYQHQKQQMIAMEKANGDMKHDASDDDSEEDNVEGDYTVYECPGLAPTGEMEVINPLFRGGEEHTAASSETPSAPPDSGQGHQ